MLLRKLLYLLPMFVTVGLGSLPNLPGDVGGFIVIAFSETKITQQQVRGNKGIVLFDFEM